ncbi:hypothetical protein, partial [uncultured Citrobacter sp.]|uniref:hypothetical protein n=1 Tax=uncultured Citrobacter sp. TaxID=200446 RepID=UPI00266C14A6
SSITDQIRKARSLSGLFAFVAFVGLISEAPSGKTSRYNRHCRMRRRRLIRPTGEALAGRIFCFSDPTFDLHFICKNCAPLPTDC